jgi:hypothetical protein
MARAWLDSANPVGFIDDDLRQHCRALREGRREPQSAADLAALAILRPR